MKYLIKVPKINKNSKLQIMTKEQEEVGVISIKNRNITITKTETNETYKIVSNPLKFKNRFIIEKNDKIEARIHVGKKIIHSIIEHGEYCFVKSSLFQYKYKVYIKREVVANLDLVKIEKERFYEINSKNDDFLMIVSLFLLARAVRFKAFLKEEAYNMYCNICNNQTTLLVHPKTNMRYHHCSHCDFIIKDETHFINGTEEKARYDTHNNDDETYKNIFRKFVEDYITPLNVKTVLDYGSGPYPVLYNELKNDYEAVHFDPFYHPSVEYLEKTYDLICIIEVIEHMYQPRMELEKLIKLLNVNGYLLIKTSFRNMSETEFFNWWYQRDETHVGFFNEKTFLQLTKQFHLSIIQSNDKDVILLQKLGD